MDPEEPQYHPSTPRVLLPLREFLRTESSGGVVLLVAALVALVWANSPLSASYFELWDTVISLEAGSLSIRQDLRHWVNDGLMTIFFFVVSLEIKREFLDGELSDRRAALLPVVAAIGGMVVPALVYLALNHEGAAARGWGIPVATDIAFAVGVLVLSAPGIPKSAKVLLLSIAIVDDIGAIALIAVAYTDVVHVLPLLVAGGAVVSIVALRALGLQSAGVYVVPAVVLWAATLESGIHATIAGVVLGFLTPVRQHDLPDAPEDRAKTVRTVSVGERLEHALHPWSSFVVVPLFALANAGVRFVDDDIGALLTSAPALGVALGLVVGKTIGIAGAAALAVRARIASLPPDVDGRTVLGLALLGGIGFTVSLFIGDLAFDDAALDEAAKAGIFLGSLVAGVAGGLVVRRGSGRDDG